MKIRLRVIAPEDRRKWEEPYIATYRTAFAGADVGVFVGTAILEVLRDHQHPCDDSSWDTITVGDA